MHNITTLFRKTVVCHIVQYCLLSILLASLSACSEVSYDVGRSSEDLPPIITSIYFENVIPLTEDFVGSSEVSNIPTSDPVPADTAFIAKIVQSDIAIDLVRRGYKVNHDSLEHHDICMTIFLFYQPDEWPIANRYIHLSVEVSKPNGAAIFHAETIRENWFGSMGDYVGFSGENMMADTAHHVVDLILGQL